MTRDDITPNTSLGTWGRSKLGNATSYVLFSTEPEDVAKVDSEFNAAVLGGLKGNGRAKTWIGGKMCVTFNYLSSYVQQTLKKDNLEPEKKGPLAADDRIVELDPTPRSKCNVEVVDAGPNDQFILSIADVRGLSLAPVSFTGPQKVFEVVPEDYLFRLATVGGIEILQIDPPPAMSGVDLYDDRKIRFQMALPEFRSEVRPEIRPEVRPEVRPEASPAMRPEIRPEIAPEVAPTRRGPPRAPRPTSPRPLIASTGNVAISGFPNASVSFQEIATGASQTGDPG